MNTLTETIEGDRFDFHPSRVIASVARQSRASWSGSGLPRCARNDEFGVMERDYSLGKV